MGRWKPSPGWGPQDRMRCLRALAERIEEIGRLSSPGSAWIYLDRAVKVAGLQIKLCNYSAGALEDMRAEIESECGFGD